MLPITKGSVTSRAVDENGVVEMLFAAMIVTAFFIAVALGIDTKRVKDARTKGDELADMVCAQAVHKLPITKHAVSAATAIIRTKDTSTGSGNEDIDLNSFIRVSQFRILAPTSYLDIPADFSTELPYVAGAPVSVASLGHADCPVSGICRFGGDVEDGAVSGNYPTGYWSREKFNDYVSCEIDLEIDTLISGRKTAKSKASYRLRAAGPSIDPVIQPEGAGLIIGIAPQFQTYADPRFMFPADPQYDDYDTMRVLPTRNFAFSGARSSFNDPRFGTPILAESEALVPDTFNPATWVKLGRRNGLSATVDVNPQTFALGRAYNPYLAVRNTLIDLVMSKLRSSEFRTDTQLLLLNSRSEIPPGATNPPRRFNWPTWIVERGEDLFAPIFEMPYTNFQPPYSAAGSFASKGGRANITAAGYLCPFTSGCTNPDGGTTNPDWAEDHMLFVSQLRDTFFVFNESARDVTFEQMLVSDDNYEDPDLVPQISVPYDYPSGGGLQEQWGFPSSAPSYRMTAQEIVRSMPSLEICPFPVEDPAGRLCNPFNPVRDADARPSSLIGDISAFLRFVNGTGNAGAYPAPGFLEGASAGGITPATIRNPEATDEVPFASHVLLFLSERIDPEEMSFIEDQVDALAPGRILTVVYLPTYWMNDGDEDAEVRDDILDAFEAEEGQQNRVFRLFPDRDACGPTEESECFRDYWLSLLQPGIPGNLEDIADSIFRTFTTTEVSL